MENSWLPPAEGSWNTPVTSFFQLRSYLLTLFVLCLSLSSLLKSSCFLQNWEKIYWILASSKIYFMIKNDVLERQDNDACIYISQHHRVWPWVGAWLVGLDYGINKWVVSFKMEAQLLDHGHHIFKSDSYSTFWVLCYFKTCRSSILCVFSVGCSHCFSPVTLSFIYPFHVQFSLFLNTLQIYKGI